MGKAAITTHVLDLDNGHPAANVVVTLAHPSGRSLSGTTNDDGRIDEWSGDVDLTAGLFNDALDVFTTGANQRSDFIRVDSNRGDSGSVLAEFLARFGKGFCHLFQNCLTSFLGLLNRLFHDPQRQPLEFEIQLEASDS